MSIDPHLCKEFRILLFQGVWIYGFVSFASSYCFIRFIDLEFIFPLYELDELIEFLPEYNPIRSISPFLKPMLFYSNSISGTRWGFDFHCYFFISTNFALPFLSYDQFCYLMLGILSHAELFFFLDAEFYWLFRIELSSVYLSSFLIMSFEFVLSSDNL